MKKHLGLKQKLRKKLNKRVLFEVSNLKFEIAGYMARQAVLKESERGDLSGRPGFGRYFGWRCNRMKDVPWVLAADKAKAED